ncbi:MAG: hypothetical protein EAZ47_02430 [Bacteroidetes bacterium]|nr:MAG: hypothetical protein EAZ47_02430 [Bacteroidota bacterium]
MNKTQVWKWIWLQFLVQPLLLSSTAYAQVDSLGVKQEMDLTDYYRKYISRKKAIDSNLDTSENKAAWTVLPMPSFTPQTGFAASVSANRLWATSKDANQYQSTFNISGTGTALQQYLLETDHTIWRPGNKTVFMGDYRYIVYPQPTFGLGGSSKLSNENLIDYNMLRISEFVYRKLAANWLVGGGYVLNHFFNIKEQGNPDGSDSDFKQWGSRSSTTSSGLGIGILSDTRSNENNPVAGSHFLNIQFLQNLRLLGSNTEWHSLTVDTRKYLPVGKKNILAFWGMGWFTFNSPAPYLELPSTGWDATGNKGRGYMQARFRGQNLLYLESEYRFSLTQNGFLGAVVFANAQSVTDWPSNRFTRIHPGGGSGLRIKLNKKSATNLAVDYAIGAGGSRGLFINLTEVF